MATARHAIASGKLDMVGMTRAHMADPNLVRKVIEGREEDTRPSSLECQARIGVLNCYTARGIPGTRSWDKSA